MKGETTGVYLKPGTHAFIPQTSMERLLCAWRC